MLGLYLFGPHVEEALGRPGVPAVLPVASGVAAALLHLVIVATLMPYAANVPLVGASGAIFGVLGLFAVRFWRARVRVLFFPANSGDLGDVGVRVARGAGRLDRGRESQRDGQHRALGACRRFPFGLAISLPLKMREESRREYAVEDAEKAVASGHLEQAAAHYRAVLETRRPQTPPRAMRWGAS